METVLSSCKVRSDLMQSVIERVKSLGQYHQPTKVEVNVNIREISPDFFAPELLQYCDIRSSLDFVTFATSCEATTNGFVSYY